MSRILFIGDLNQYGRSYQRYLTLQQLGHDVVAHSHTFVSKPNQIDPPSVLFRIFSKLRFPLDNMHTNANIRREILMAKFDIIWIEKGNMIWPWTLRWLRNFRPKLKIISVSEDDMYVRHGYSQWYKYGLHFYDFVFTTKTYNLAELKEFGARETILFLDSFCENFHKPFQLTPVELTRFQCDVGAIGAFEIDRANSMLCLAEQGIKVVVWGNDWEPWINKHPNLIVKNQFLFGDEYSKAICATKINLNFLRKINRDQVTSRSVEIPACGGFMLGERTQRHMEFFKEGQEAEYFGNNQELLSKVRFYLENSKKREEIALAGRQRCVTSGYGMRDQLAKMVEQTLNI